MRKTNGILQSSLRKCSKCLEIRSINDFARDISKPLGLHPECKICRKKYYLKNRERFLILRRENVKKNHEKIKFQKREFYKKNRIKIRSDAKIRYVKFKYEILSKNKQWRSQSVKGQYLTCKRGAMIRNLDFKISLEEFSSMIGRNCRYCGDILDRPKIDRLDNEVGYISENIVPCCTTCNRMKWTHTEEGFYKQLKKILNWRSGNIKEDWQPSVLT